MYSPSQSPLPPPSLPNPSGSSQCTRPEHLSHSNSIETCILSIVKQITSPGWMQPSFFIFCLFGAAHASLSMYTVNPPWIDGPQTLRQQVEGRRHSSHLLDRLKNEPCELSSIPYSSSSPWCYEVCLVDLQTSGLEFLKYLIGF